MVTYKVSSFCNFGECVEVGQLPDGFVTVRDTKDPERRTSLTFTRDEWEAFVKGVKNGEVAHARRFLSVVAELATAGSAFDEPDAALSASSALRSS